MANFDTIPAELQLDIVDALSGDVLLNFRQTSWCWKNSIDHRQNAIIDRILATDLAFEHQFFEQWREKLGSDVIRERAVTTILETEMLEKGRLEMGAYQKSFLWKELHDAIPWEAPFLNPGFMILSYHEFVPAHTPFYVGFGQSDIVRLKYSSYRRPPWKKGFGKRCQKAYTNLSANKLKYLSFLIHFRNRRLDAMKGVRQNYTCLLSEEKLAKLVHLHFVLSACSVCVRSPLKHENLHAQAAITRSISEHASQVRRDEGFYSDVDYWPSLARQRRGRPPMQYPALLAPPSFVYGEAQYRERYHVYGEEDDKRSRQVDFLWEMARWIVSHHPWYYRDIRIEGEPASQSKRSRQKTARFREDIMELVSLALGRGDLHGRGDYAKTPDIPKVAVDLCMEFGSIIRERRYKVSTPPPCERLRVRNMISDGSRGDWGDADSEDEKNTLFETSIRPCKPDINGARYYEFVGPCERDNAVLPWLFGEAEAPEAHWEP